MRPTPRLTDHARGRCAEMGISTKIAKRIYQYADTILPGNPGTPCQVARSDQYPQYRVVFQDHGNCPVIVTVDFYSLEPYVRNGATFIPATGDQ